MSFWETFAQNVFGQIISFCVLTAFRVPHATAFGLMAAMFAASYIRSYIIRRVFNELEKRNIQ